MRYWEDVAIGETYRTPSRTITETDIVCFAALTGDFMPFHVDEIFARQTIYRGRIAHGLLGLAYMEGLKTRTPFDVATMGSVGWTIDFRAPIRIGDTLTCEFRVAAKRETRKPDRGLLTLAVRLLNQRGEVVQEGEHRRMVRRRPTRGARSAGRTRAARRGGTTGAPRDTARSRAALRSRRRPR